MSESNRGLQCSNGLGGTVRPTEFVAGAGECQVGHLEPLRLALFGSCWQQHVRVQYLYAVINASAYAVNSSLLIFSLLGAQFCSACATALLSRSRECQLQAGVANGIIPGASGQRRTQSQRLTASSAQHLT